MKTLSEIADDAVKGYNFSEDYIYGGVGSILLVAIDSVEKTGSPEAFLRFAVAYQEGVNGRLVELFPDFAVILARCFVVVQ